MDNVATKSQQIQDLVQKMKAGKITKTDLFSELSKLQKNSKNVQAKASQPSSSPERRAAIQRLFEEKRQQHEQLIRNRSEGKQNVNQLHSPRKIPQKTPDYIPRTSPPPSPTQQREHVYPVQQQNYVTQQQWQQQTENDPLESEYAAEHSRPSPRYQYARSYSSPSVEHGTPSYQHAPEFASTQQRSHSFATRDKRAEQLISEIEAKKMEECTFHPKIKELPNSYLGKTMNKKVPLEHRTMRWRQQKLEAAQKRKEERAMNELEECTFHPRINASSRQTVEQARRYQHRNVDAAERLYSDSKRNRKAELMAKYRAEEEEKLRKECTFRPNVNRRYPTPVKSRYRNSTPKKSRPSSTSAVEEEYSFTPKVNPIPANMGAAQLYVSTNIFERLSRSRDDFDVERLASEKGKTDDQQIMDISTFLSSQETTGERKRPSSAPRERPRASSISTSNEGKRISQRERDERKKRFEQFLARQNQKEKKRQKNIKDVEKRTNPSHKPKLCKKSLNMASSVRQGSFLQRVAKDAMRKQHVARKLKVDRNEDPECTFKPKITKAAQKMRARTTTELSRGDSLRKETNTRLMKLKAEQEEVAGHTFHPMLNPSNVQGRLKVLTEPETYIQRLQREAKIFSEKQRLAVQEQEIKEFAECTFRPEVHDAPSYVKRIARSMALTRSTKSKTEKPSRPDWR